MVRGVCSAPLCTDNAYRSDYCDQHVLLRNQHATSHVLDGHSKQKIEMCPNCEAITIHIDQTKGFL